MTIDELKEKFELGDDALAEITKLVQSETDKVRTDYSKQIKELEQFKPKEKTQEEIEVEQMKQELAELKFQKSLAESGIDSNIGKYIRNDVDFNELSEVLKGYGAKQDYKPSNKGGSNGLTKEQFKQLGYSEKAKLYEENPTLYAELNK